MTPSNTSNIKELDGSFAFPTQPINCLRHDIHMYLLYYQSHKNFIFCIHCTPRISSDQDGDHLMTLLNSRQEVYGHLPLLQKQTSKHDIRMLRMDACYLELNVPSRSRRDGPYDFLDHYGDAIARPLFPSEAIHN
ncbi:hypothetical protein Tco_0535475 [Tanacetum coccineum]